MNLFRSKETALLAEIAAKNTEISGLRIAFAGQKAEIAALTEDLKSAARSNQMLRRLLDTAYRENAELTIKLERKDQP